MATTTKKPATKSSTKQLTPREVGEELGLDQRAVRRAIRSGKLKAATTESGKRWTIDAAEVKRFAAEQQKQ